MILQILLLIVGSYLSMSFTLFLLCVRRFQNESNSETIKIKQDNLRREEKLDKILELQYEQSNKKRNDELFDLIYKG